MSSKPTLSFAEQLETLEALVARLESPDTPLELVVSTFTEAQKLMSSCQKRLAEAELILEKATATDGQTEQMM
jgi:exodeoxyribonuclease VII small subunit